MAAPAMQRIPSPNYSQLSPETLKLLDDVDTDFRAKHQEAQEKGEKKIKGASCGICIYRWEGKQVSLLLGELQGKQGEEAAFNGKYATFSGKPKFDDFQDGFAPYNTAMREAGEELGISPEAFVKAFNSVHTCVVLNNAYKFFHAPVFFVRSTPEIEQTIAAFKPNKEITRLRWVDADSIVESTKKVQATYNEACKGFRVLGPQLRAQWNQGREAPLTDKEFQKRLDDAVRDHKGLQEIRNGEHEATDAVTGESILVAPYSARTVLEAEGFIKDLQLASCEEADEKKA